MQNVLHENLRLLNNYQYTHSYFHQYIILYPKFTLKIPEGIKQFAYVYICIHVLQISIHFGSLDNQEKNFHSF